MSKCIAIDLGASSGRVVLASLEGKRVKLTEIHRFEIKTKQEEYLMWDIEDVFNEILRALKQVGRDNIEIDSIAIDTWGVDYVWLDEFGNLISGPISYRDQTIKDSLEDVHQLINKKDLFTITGIQSSYYNSIYRIYRDHQNGVEGQVVFLPCYLAYRLSNVIKNEYTIATSSQLIDCKSKKYSKNIISKLGLTGCFADLIDTGAVYGYLHDAIKERCHLNDGIKIIAGPGHDTAAAFNLSDNDTINVILGTWTLVGFTSNQAVLSDEVYELGYTNEGGYDKKNRLIKNITGLWVMNRLKADYEKIHGYVTFEELLAEARHFKRTDLVVDIQDPVFLNPDDMYVTLKSTIKDKYGQIDLPIGLLVMLVINGIVTSILCSIKELMTFSRKLSRVRLMGGGIHNKLLIERLLESIDLPVMLGPSEASSLGNAIAQFKSLGFIGETGDIDYTIECE